MLTEKDYCDYETCVALEELGFPQDYIFARYAKVNKLVDYTFHKKGDLIISEDRFAFTLESESIVAPLLYEAQKFLREEKNIIVEATFNLMHEGQPRFSWRVLYNLTQHKGAYYTFDSVKSKEDYDSYEEALSEGIKEAVKLLK